MKSLARTAIRRLVFSAPWGIRQAILDACIDRIGDSVVCARLLGKMHISEIGADGDCGLITSAWNDQYVLPEYARHGTFFNTVTDAVLGFLDAQSGTYFDVGANIGLTTINIARNKMTRCLAFEPEPSNFDFLLRNIARNLGEGAVECHQVALFHTRSTMSLAIATQNTGDHRLTASGVPGRRSIDIAAVPLDDFLDRVRGPLAVKVDTQGAEPFVIAGGRAVFARAGLVALEFCPYLMRQLGGDPGIVIDLLAGFDRVAVLHGGSADALSYRPPADARRTLRDKLATAAASDADYLDIVAIRDTAPAT